MAHETIECDLQNKSEEFIDVYKKANPGGRAKVPVLEIDGEMNDRFLPTLTLAREAGDQAVGAAQLCREAFGLVLQSSQRIEQVRSERHSCLSAFRQNMLSFLESSDGYCLKCTIT